MNIYFSGIGGVAIGPLAEIARDAGVECALLALVSESPYEAIVEAAEHNACDLIFMASHGHTGIGHLLLSSITEKVLRHTKIPVLVHR